MTNKKMTKKAHLANNPDYSGKETLNSPESITLELRLLAAGLRRLNENYEKMVFNFRFLIISLSLLGIEFVILGGMLL